MEKKLGIYAGSFNPYHIGHEDIYRQASKVFDEVMIAQCYDRGKGQPANLKLKGRNVIHHGGLLYELFYKEYQVGKFLVRGLRTSFDVGYESDLRNVLLDFDPTIKIVYFFCKKEHEHVSSSMIRSLYGFGDENYKKYLVEGDI